MRSITLLLSLFLATAGVARSQAFHVESCSLLCSSGAGGAQVFCAGLVIHVDQTIRVRFNQPVDPTSLSSSTFLVIDVTNGTSALGARYVSPLDPREIVFEPTAFLSNGVLQYGLEPHHTYSVMIRGTAQGDSPPFLQSMSGAPNLSRLQCSVTTDNGFSGPVQRECTSSPNSVGPGASMNATGTTSVFLNGLTLEATQLPAATFGVFALGSLPAYRPVGDGHVCLGGAVLRLPVVAADATGRATFSLDLVALGGGITVLPASTWRFQHIYRDRVPGGAGFNTSDAVRVTFYP